MADKQKEIVRFHTHPRGGPATQSFRRTVIPPANDLFSWSSRDCSWAPFGRPLKDTRSWRNKSADATFWMQNNNIERGGSNGDDSGPIYSYGAARGRRDAGHRAGTCSRRHSGAARQRRQGATQLADESSHLRRPALLAP